MPEGWHEFQIKRVTEDPAVLRIELAHDDPRYWWVKVTMHKGQKYARILAGQLAAALAMTPDDWESNDSGDLVGRRVRADITHKAQGGRLYVNVWKFGPIEQLAEEAAAIKPEPKPARTPAAKVRAASPAIGSDDIPF